MLERCSSCAPLGSIGLAVGHQPDDHRRETEADGDQPNMFILAHHAFAFDEEGQHVSPIPGTPCSVIA